MYSDGQVFYGRSDVVRIEMGNVSYSQLQSFDRFISCWVNFCWLNIYIEHFGNVSYSRLQVFDRLLL